MTDNTPPVYDNEAMLEIAFLAQEAGLVPHSLSLRDHSLNPIGIGEKEEDAIEDITLAIRSKDRQAAERELNDSGYRIDSISFWEDFGADVTLTVWGDVFEGRDDGDAAVVVLREVLATRA